MCIRDRLRAGSGGAGERRGGDGLVRRLLALAPMTVSMISGRRSTGAPGLGGGLAGQPGLNLINDSPRPASFSEPIDAGDIVEVRTPGGGGCGVPDR